MSLAKLVYLPLIALLIFNQCSDPKKNNSTKTPATIQQQIKQPIEKKKNEATQEEEKKEILLDDQNAIPFFFNYEKENPENKVRFTTRH